MATGRLVNDPDEHAGAGAVCWGDSGGGNRSDIFLDLPFLPVILQKVILTDRKNDE